MKKSTLLMPLMVMAFTANAQYINQAPEGGFDTDGGKDYVVLYAPAEVIAKMGDKVLTNNTLDPDQVKNSLEYWVTDWDPKDLTLYNVPEEDGKNSFGGTDYVNATPLYEWGTGVFVPKAQAYDLSKVTDEHYLHIGLRDFGSAPSQYKFSIGSQSTIKTNGFQIEVGIDAGAADGDFVGVGKIAGGNDGKWYYLDIPVKDLVDEDGDFGFTYNFASPISDGVFAFTFSKPTCSTATKTGPAPGESVYTYEIKKLGSALSIDHVFFYKKTQTGIHNATTADGAEAVYDLQGRRTQMAGAGIYVVKTATGVKKVLKK